MNAGTHSFTAGIFILCIIQTQTLLLVAIVDVGINELVNQPHLQREESLVGWQGSIAQSPQCARVDASDSYQTPEQVLPPFPAWSNNAVIRSHLIQIVYAAHRLVPPYTPRYWHLDQLTFPMCQTHGAIASVSCSDHINIALAMPLAQTHTVIVSPLLWLTSVSC